MATIDIDNAKCCHKVEDTIIFLKQKAVQMLKTDDTKYKIQHKVFEAGYPRLLDKSQEFELIVLLVFIPRSVKILLNM